MLAKSNPACAHALRRRVEAFVQRQPFGVRAADQEALHGNLVDCRCDQAARGLDFNFQVARQPFVFAAVFAVALAEQHRAARLELLREHGDGGAGLCGAPALGFRLPGCAVDFGGAVTDRDDEMRGGGGVIGDLAGGFVLLRHRAVDVFEHRADRLDCLRDAMHRIDRAGGILLQRVDLLGDLLGGALGLHCERLDFGCDHREAASGRAYPGRLDGGVEREQRGLPRDLRDQVDDITDGGGGRRRRLGASGDGMGGALELPDHRAEFELEQFEDFACGIAVGRGGRIGRHRCRHSLRLNHRRSRFRQTPSKKTERHRPLSGTCNEAVILAFGREVIVNDCLIFRQATLPLYRHDRRIFDFDGFRAYNAAFSTPDKNRTNPERERMAGHSQFKNIMHPKGRQDPHKPKLSPKLAREITAAAKMGQPDPSMNARLRAAIISARQENMSKDSIERAVKKASGSESENYDEIRYERYGPGGVAVIVQALTDNRNRAASDIRSYFTKSGGNLRETRSYPFLFERTDSI